MGGRVRGVARGHAIAAGATAALVAASAGAVYANHLRLMPRLLGAGRPWRHYAAALLAAVGLLDLAAVVAIQLVYAWLWHPDPRRFGFWFNVAADGAIIAAHLAVAAGLVWALRRRARPAPVLGAA